MHTNHSNDSNDSDGGSGSRPVLVIIGPSASGKSSLVRSLHQRGLVKVHPTWTTRPRRHDEVAGAPEHRFVSEEVFDDLAAQGFFLDTVQLFGLPYRYGLPPLTPSSAGPLDVVMLRAPLVARFARFVPHHLVYQIEGDPERTSDRLVGRGCSPVELAGRLIDNDREVRCGRRMADRVFVNDGPLDALVHAVAAALRSDAMVVA